MNLNHLKQAGEVVVMPVLTEKNYGNLERCATELHTALKDDWKGYFDKERKEFAMCVAIIRCASIFFLLSGVEKCPDNMETLSLMCSESGCY